MTLWNRFSSSLRVIWPMVLGVGIVLVSGPSAKAQFTMAQLVALGNTGVTVGGEHFYDFTYNPDAFRHSGFASAPNATQVVVNFTSIVGPPVTAVEMSEKLVKFFAGNSGVADINFSFNVDASPNFKLTRTLLFIGGTTMGAGTATADETVHGLTPGGFDGPMHVQKNGTGPIFQNLIFTPNQFTISGAEHLQVSSLHQGDMGDISGNTQIFYEALAPVPEPASAALLALGALGLCGFRYCRKKYSQS